MHEHLIKYIRYQVTRGDTFDFFCYMTQNTNKRVAQNSQVQSFYYLVPMNRYQVLECFGVPVVILLIEKLKAQNALNMLHA